MKNERLIVSLAGRASQLLVYFYGILGIFIAFSNASNAQYKEQQMNALWNKALARQVGNDFQNIALTRREEMPLDSKHEIIDVSGFSQSQGRSWDWFQSMQDWAQPTPYTKEERQAHRVRSQQRWLPRCSVPMERQKWWNHSWEWRGERKGIKLYWLDCKKQITDFPIQTDDA